MKKKIFNNGLILLPMLLMAGSIFAKTNARHIKNSRLHLAMAVDSGPSTNIGYITMPATGGSAYFDGSLTNSVSSGSAATVATNGGTLVVASNLGNGAGAIINHGTAPITVGGPYAGSATVSMNTFFNKGTYNQTTGIFTAGAIYNAAAGVLNLGTVGGDLIINNNTAAVSGVNYAYYNLGTYTQSTATTYFSGTMAQTLASNSVGTNFNNVTVNGGNTATMTYLPSGDFTVAPNCTLSVTNGSTLAVNYISSYPGSNFASQCGLTLLSTANGDARIGDLTNGAITGIVNVQRFLTGGSLAYRGYRLFGLPVNVSNNTTGAGNITIDNVNRAQQYYMGSTPVSAAGAATGGPVAAQFTIKNANPTFYLYDESLTTNNATFTSGKNVGITGIANQASVTTFYGSTTTPGVTIPAGNGILFYFIGSTTGRTTGSTSIVPDNTAIGAYGTPNQGDVPVHLWNNPASTSLSYTATDPHPGFNQVGNPYASAISLDQVYTDNHSASNNISPNFYELVEPGQSYIAYNAVSHNSSSSYVGKYIASGQGFLVDVTAASQTLTFKEDQKVNYQFGGANQPLIMALKPTPAKTNAGLHLQLTKDAVANTQTGVYFNSDWSDKYNYLEDALDFNGINSAILLASLTADGDRVGINSMGNYIGGKRVKLFVKASASARYNLKMVDIKSIDTIYNVFLVDNLLKDSVDLRTKDYNFTITTTDTTTFGANRFVLAVELKVLPPYQLLTFTGKKLNTGVQLAWTTTNEGNYTTFGLQRQSGSKYVTIDSLQSTGGGSYSYLDVNATIGLNTYRLAQNNASGNVTYSQPVTVNTNTDGALLSVYPNPARDNISVNVNLAPAVYKMSIYNSLGALVKQVSMSSNTWAGNIAPSHPGTYIIQVNDQKGNFIGKTKFVKVQ